MEFQAVSGPKFTGPFSSSAEGIARDYMSFRFSISCPVPEIFAVKVRSGRKLPEILHVFGPPFFFGGGECPPNFWTVYLIEPISDHVAKFHGDRSRDGGGKLAKEKKEKKTSRAFYKSSRPNYN